MVELLELLKSRRNVFFPTGNEQGALMVFAAGGGFELGPLAATGADGGGGPGIELETRLFIYVYLLYKYTY